MTPPMFEPPPGSGPSDRFCPTPAPSSRQVLPRRALLGAVLALASPQAALAIEAMEGLLMGPDMLARLRGQAALGQHREALERQAGDPVLGREDAPVTFVLFSDYRCPYCRELSVLLLAFLDRTPDLRLVVKEWPIFGGLSVTMARTALAAGTPGTYRRLHEAFFRARPRSEAAVADLARATGLDPKEAAGRLDPKIDRQLERTAGLAATLGLRGTPVLVAGRRIVPGYVDEEVLADLFREAGAPG